MQIPIARFPEDAEAPSPHPALVWFADPAASLPQRRQTGAHLTGSSLGRPCALTSNGQKSPQSFLKDCLPGYNPQVGSNKILYFFLRLTINQIFHGQYNVQNRQICRDRRLVGCGKGWNGEQEVTSNW